MTTETTIEELKAGLIEMINDEIDAYGEDSGWKKFSEAELDAIVDRYISEVTDEEIDNYYDNDEDEYGDRDGAIMCYLNEWADADEVIGF
jgi:hypothetical protein